MTAIPLDSVHRLDFKNLEYIFKSKSISYQYTANQCTASKRIFQSAQKVRILGMTANYEADNIPGFRSSTIKKRRALLPLLNDAHEQTDILAQQFEGDFYIEKYATEYYFKKYAPQYDVLHLSLYPGLNQQSMDKNYLAFSEDGHQQEDNFLVTTEIQALPLHVGLTVLNYSKIDCRQMSNANGLMAISAAFMYAGSQAVLYNLWSNKSDFLPAILSSYYQNLQANLPKDRALQKAKLDYLKASNDTTAHPAYWASLLQFGALDPLEISEPVIHIWWFVLPIAFIGILGWWCLQGLKQRKK